MMNQIVNENTRYRGDDEPARLDLVFTRVQINDDLRYECPLGKNDHVVIEMEAEVNSAYKIGVTRFVPKYNPREEGKKDWFNVRGARAKKKRDEAWKKKMKETEI
ncbi:hypothetical protein E2C01_033365 [Portunus trituberculatus]|uniref:Uncharacterized protein n=1 Tax=Portunus trituberculatus TaxID=210409 RepID=A0A5B7F386_PORTR|nr:hypothetical protein [Portunus trituberculatus]